MAKLIEQSSAVYLTVHEGDIVRRMKQPNDRTVQRTTKEGKVVYEERYGAVAGRITNIQFKDHEQYGRFVNITLTDEDGSTILQLKQGSGAAMAFLKTLPNVDLTQEVKLTPSQKIEGDKKKTSMFINQGGDALKWAYTKDNPNGIPALKKIKVKGKEQYDDSDIVEFLENMVVEQILPSLKVVAAAPANEEDPF